MFWYLNCYCSFRFNCRMHNRCLQSHPLLAIFRIMAKTAKHWRLLYMITFLWLLMTSLNTEGSKTLLREMDGNINSDKLRFLNKTVIQTRYITVNWVKSNDQLTNYCNSLISFKRLTVFSTFDSQDWKCKRMPVSLKQENRQV